MVYELLTLCSVNGVNRVELCDDVQILHAYPSGTVDVKQVERVMLHLFCTFTRGPMKLVHRLIKKLLHTIHGGAESLYGLLYLVAERLDESSNLQQRRLEHVKHALHLR